MKTVARSGYSHKDKGWKDRVGSQLKVLERQDLRDANGKKKQIVDILCDEPSRPGVVDRCEWFEEMTASMQAEIVIANSI